MTVSDDPFEPSDPTDAALDRLLARARWREVDEQRLREQWVALSRKRRWSMPIYSMLAAAAAIALIIVTFLAVRESARYIAISAVPENPGEAKYFVVESSQQSPTQHIESRAATLSEQLALLSTTSPASAPTQKIEYQDTKTEPQDPAVAALIQQLGAPSMENRFEAAQQLARIDQPQVIAMLAEMVRQDINVREALLALKLSQNPQAAEVLARLPVSRAELAQLDADQRGVQSGS